MKKSATEQQSKVKKKIHYPQRPEFPSSLGNKLPPTQSIPQGETAPLGKIIPTQTIAGILVEIEAPKELNEEKLRSEHYREQAEERGLTKRKIGWLRNIGTDKFEAARCSKAIKKIMEIRGISLEVLHERLLYREKISITALTKFVNHNLLCVSPEVVMEIARLIDANPYSLVRYFVIDKVNAAKKSMNVLIAERVKKWFRTNGWMYYKDGLKKPYVPPKPLPYKKKSKKGAGNAKNRKTFSPAHARTSPGSNNNASGSSLNRDGNKRTR